MNGHKRFATRKRESLARQRWNRAGVGGEDEPCNRAISNYRRLHFTFAANGDSIADLDLLLMDDDVLDDRLYLLSSLGNCKLS